jgi:colanic acid biosynthesis glycosyl transferase WcaI
MHILIVSHYYPPNEGAASYRMKLLAEYLVEKGHTLTVLTTLPHYPKGMIASAYQGQFASKQLENGVTVIRTWLLATPSPRISHKLISQVSFMLTASLRGLGIARPDVIFIEAQPMFTGFVGRFLSLLKGVPYAQNISDLWPDHLLSVGALQESDRTYKIARALMDSGYRQAKALTSMSPVWSRKLSEYTQGQDDKIHTILRGVDLEMFRPNIDTHAFRQKYQLGNARIVSFIGTFATQYDFETQLNVAERLSHHDDTLFVYIGTGSQQELVQRKAEKLKNVRLIDWIPHEEIPQAWNVSAVHHWAMHSNPLYEGTIPAKLFEAFACGVPIVAAQNGEAAHMISESHGGVVVPTGDEVGLAHALERVLNDEPLLQHMRINARDYAKLHFNALDSLAQYEQVLTTIVQK